MIREMGNAQYCNTVRYGMEHLWLYYPFITVRSVNFSIEGYPCSTRQMKCAMHATLQSVTTDLKTKSTNFRAVSSRKLQAFSDIFVPRRIAVVR